MNLLANAVDAVEEVADDRAAQITVRTLTIGNSVRIGVTDNGIGMNADTQKSLFNPFFTTKSVGKGTGLGLSISYKIITEKHHGKIWAESEVGQGTTFWIELSN